MRLIKSYFLHTYIFGIGSSPLIMVIISLISGDGVVCIVNPASVNQETMRFERGRVWHSLMMTFEPKKLAFELPTKQQHSPEHNNTKGVKIGSIAQH